MALQWSKEHFPNLLAEVAARMRAGAEDDLRRGKQLGAQALQEQAKKLEDGANAFAELLDDAQSILKANGIQDKWPEGVDGSLVEKESARVKPGHYTYVRYLEQFPKVGIGPRSLGLILAGCALDESGTRPKHIEWDSVLVAGYSDLMPRGKADPRFSSITANATQVLRGLKINIANWGEEKSVELLPELKAFASLYRSRSGCENVDFGEVVDAALRFKKVVWEKDPSHAPGQPGAELGFGKRELLLVEAFFALGEDGHPVNHDIEQVISVAYADILTAPAAGRVVTPWKSCMVNMYPTRNRMVDKISRLGEERACELLPKLKGMLAYLRTLPAYQNVSFEKLLEPAFRVPKGGLLPRPVLTEVQRGKIEDLRRVMFPNDYPSAKNEATEQVKVELDTINRVPVVEVLTPRSTAKEPDRRGFTRDEADEMETHRGVLFPTDEELPVRDDLFKARRQEFERATMPAYAEARERAEAEAAAEASKLNKASVENHKRDEAKVTTPVDKPQPHTNGAVKAVAPAGDVYTSPAVEFSPKATREREEPWDFPKEDSITDFVLSPAERCWLAIGCLYTHTETYTTYRFNRPERLFIDSLKSIKEGESSLNLEERDVFLQILKDKLLASYKKDRGTQLLLNNNGVDIARVISYLFGNGFSEGFIGLLRNAFKAAREYTPKKVVAI